MKTPWLEDEGGDMAQSVGRLGLSVGILVGSKPCSVIKWSISHLSHLSVQKCWSWISQTPIFKKSAKRKTDPRSAFMLDRNLINVGFVLNTPILPDLSFPVILQCSQLLLCLRLSPPWSWGKRPQRRSPLGAARVPWRGSHSTDCPQWRSSPSVWGWCRSHHT